ncbi:MAG: His-Xaa-Ser system radical SAM maturase HxsC [Christensenellaceae bacterium]|jgi:His-Xaa-Ser system radical SAM maturase HxsC|nr:His-Xaa-Ser system radical SAM maturase HxsC [Christensenellaceae bacterium]
MKTFIAEKAHIINSVFGKIVTERVNWFGRKNDLILVSGNHIKGDENYAFVIYTSDQNYLDFPHLVCKSIVPQKNIRTGDIAFVDVDGAVKIEYEYGSPHNYIFVTNRCNCCCLCCPNNQNEKMIFSNIAHSLDLINLIEEKDIPCLVITGGEPTLVDEELVDLLKKCGKRFPNTLALLLSNGINFSQNDYVKKIAKAAPPKFLIDIPIFADVPSIHNYIMGSSGFYKTINGIMNLNRNGINVGIRVILNKLNCNRLVNIANYIYRNLTFVYHVSFMQMEPSGNAANNIKTLWIDPKDYVDQLSDAVEFLLLRGITTEIYNFQLCLLPDTMRPYASRSISSWKNIYLDQCSLCCRQKDCAGFFASQLTCHSAFIRPILN